jgi:hypothetical protein
MRRMFSVSFSFSNDELVRVLRFEPLEIGDDVHTVDAAVSPEIQQHHLAAQARHRERLVGVQPALAAREFRRARAPVRLHIHLVVTLSHERRARARRVRPPARRRQHDASDQ